MTEKAPSRMGKTFAERAAARLASEGKQVKADSVEDKAVKRDGTKSKPKASPRKGGAESSDED